MAKIAAYIPEITAAFSRVLGVEFTTKQATAILAGNPALIDEIEDWGGIDDPELTNGLLDTLSQRFLGRDWPHDAEGVRLDEFMFDLKTKAAQQGFSLIPHDYEDRPFRSAI